MSRITHTATAPASALTVVMACVPKPLSEERASGLILGSMRLWFRLVKPSLADLCEGRAPFWNTVLRGSGALRGTLARAATIESVVVTGRLSCAVLLDIDEFSDHIRLSVAVQLATDLGFPPTPLALVAQLHTASG